MGYKILTMKPKLTEKNAQILVQNCPESIKRSNDPSNIHIDYSVDIWMK